MDSILPRVTELIENIDPAHGVLLAAGIVSSLVTAYTNATKKVKCSMVGLINQAEAEYGNWEKSGKLKREWVIRQLYRLLPLPLRPLFPEAKLIKMTDAALDSVKTFVQMQTGETPREHDGGGENSGNVQCAEYVPDGGLEDYQQPEPENFLYDGEFEVSARLRVEYLSPDEIRVIVVSK